MDVDALDREMNWGNSKIINHFCSIIDVSVCESVVSFFLAGIVLMYAFSWDDVLIACAVEPNVIFILCSSFFFQDCRLQLNH